MSPQTGAVYAMSSYPSYNPSVWVGGISTAEYAALSNPANQEPLLNRAIDGLYTPGSTFKLNTATAALDSGSGTPGDYLRRQRHLQLPRLQDQHRVVHPAAQQRRRGRLRLDRHHDRAHRLERRLLLQPRRTLLRGDRSSTGRPRSKTSPMPVQPRSSRPASTSPVRRPPAGSTARPSGSSCTPRTRSPSPTPTGTPATTSRWPSARAARSSHRSSRPSRTRPSPTAAPATRRRWRRRSCRSSGKVVKRFTPQVVGHVNLPPSTYQPMLTGFEGAVNSPNGTAYGASGARFVPRWGLPARQEPPTPSRARSRPGGSSGSVRSPTRSTWWSA